MLCKTYKRDEIFADSMIKLLTRLEDELVKEQAKLEKIDEKKKNYKQLARGLNGEF